MLTDPIADMLTRIRNAYMAGHDTVEIPFSKLKYEIATKLKAEGYITSVSTEAVGGQNDVIKKLSLQLRYDKQGYPVVRFLKRVSRPGLRVYAGWKKIQRVLSGAGIALVRTNMGILTDREARKNEVGGEVLCIVY